MSGSREGRAVRTSRAKRRQHAAGVSAGTSRSRTTVVRRAESHLQPDAARFRPHLPPRDKKRSTNRRSASIGAAGGGRRRASAESMVTRRRRSASSRLVGMPVRGGSALSDPPPCEDAERVWPTQIAASVWLGAYSWRQLPRQREPCRPAAAERSVAEPLQVQRGDPVGRTARTESHRATAAPMSPRCMASMPSRYRAEESRGRTLSAHSSTSRSRWPLGKT